MPITDNDRKRLDRLFLQFAACYGQVWRSQFKNDDFIAFAKNEWMNALIEFEHRHIDEALALCRSTRDFPPTLPQFIDLCKLIKNKERPCNVNKMDWKGTTLVGERCLLHIKQRLGMSVRQPV